MKKTSISLTISALSLLGSLVATGCGDSSGDSEDAPTENTGALCSDGEDNDGDGAVDCDDAECARFCVDTATGDVAVAWDWVGIIGTGQSLAVGGVPMLNDTPEYNNLMLSLGNLREWPFDPEDPELEMVPLHAPIRSIGSGYPRPYPDNIWGETPHCAMAGQITSLVEAAVGLDYVTVHSVVGESGQPMTEIEKGAEDTGETGRAYAATLFEVTAIARLAGEAGKSYGVGAVFLTHGEADYDNTTYKEGIVRLWADYNDDIPAITGQTSAIPMFVSQQHAYPEHAGSRSPATQAQWEAGLDHPGEIICTGPKYQYEGHGDAVHLSPHGYQQYGEKLAQIYYETVILGKAWQPLQPIAAEVDGNTITVTFNVPEPPMVWDENLPRPHQNGLTEWAEGRGFEVRRESTRVTITGVEIVDDTVVITCDEDLPESGVEVAYAASTDGVDTEGAVMEGGTIRWGQLRDSDPLVGLTTRDPLPNYAVAFEMDVQ